MSLNAKRFIIAAISLIFLASLVLVNYLEVARKYEEVGLRAPHIAVPDSSKRCVDCHNELTPGIVEHWEGSRHAQAGVACVDCHKAAEGDADAFNHEGQLIATIVTPRDCGACHQEVVEEFSNSHHAKGGDILHSLDNHLAEVVEGYRPPEGSPFFNPHSPTPGRPDLGMDTPVNGLASAASGCKQCHGSLVALLGPNNEAISYRELDADPETGQPRNREALARVQRNAEGKPLFHPGTWPNTGIGRLNLDGSRGSCSACHSRHDFSPRRARQPENCGKCHLGPDHPQKEIYEESKHGAAFRDKIDDMNLDATSWVLGKDYGAAPTCATCHMSGHSRNDGKITHDPGQRISWTNRPPISQWLENGDQRRANMQMVCAHCHTPDYVSAFYKQYDDLVRLYNEKFAKPGTKLMKALLDNGLRTPLQFDEEIEWTWFYLWHHEGRRARHGAAMMAPDYTHWHGMYEVAERFYVELIPQAREIVEHAKAEGKVEQAEAVEAVIEAILARPEHQWFESQQTKPNHD